jgi:CheY-like chemotaxis protein
VKRSSLPSSNAPFFRLLCVEDNPMFQQMLKIALGIYGFEVITASHGIDALMQYKAHGGQFGAIVSDHDLCLT